MKKKPLNPKPPKTTELIVPAIEKKDYLLIFILCLGSFITYIITLCPTVYTGDSGEILSAITTLGIAHPTGFPLYIILGKLFTLILPFGDIAYRVNILSAGFAALSVGVIFITLRTLSNHRLPSAAAALCFAFSFTLWSHATVARVYTMAGFFIALLTWIILLWNANRGNKYLILFGIILGIGLGTHVMVILVVPVAIASVIVFKRQVFRKPIIISVILIVIFLAGLQYLYLPIAASNNPVVNWGNPHNLQNFLSYITQKDYSFKMAARDASGSSNVLREIARLFTWEFTPLGLVSLIGLIGYWKKYKKVFLLSSLVIIGNVLLMINYGNEKDLFTLYRYLFPSYIIIAIWIGYGINWLYVYFKRNSHFNQVAYPLLILFPITCFVANYHKNNRGKNFITYDYAYNVLTSTPESSLLLTTGDTVSGGLSYLQLLFNYRSDTILINRELITWDWHWQDIAKRYPNLVNQDMLSTPPKERLYRLIDANITRTPIYATFLILDRYKNIPHGIIYAILPKDSTPELTEIKKKNALLWKTYNKQGLLDKTIHKDYMVEEIVKAYSKAHNNLGSYYSSKGIVDEAIEEFKESLKYNPENFAGLFNLGRLYSKKGYDREAEIYLSKARAINPDFFSGNTTQSAAAISPTINADETNTVVSIIHKGINYGLKQEHDKAIKEFTQALAKGYQYPLVYINLGNAYMNKNMINEATASFEKAIALAPGTESSAAYLNLGAISANIKQDYPKAIKYLQKYIELNPDDKESEVIRNQINQMVHIILKQAEQ